jgi:hypothetical protein
VTARVLATKDYFRHLSRKPLRQNKGNIHEKNECPFKLEPAKTYKSFLEFSSTGIVYLNI